MDSSKMTPRRPYLLRAFYEWLVDNDLTPHLVVEADLPGVRVPEQFIQDGQIILNLAPKAVGNLEMGNEAITFSARFGGKPHSVIVPLFAVQAIYARENGAGTMFEPEDAYLSLMEEADDNDLFETDNSGAHIGLVDTSEQDSTSRQDSTAQEDDKPPKPKGRPTLKVVK